MVQHKSSMPPICPPSITPRGLSEQHKSTSAANRFVFWWATLRELTVQHKSSMPLICLLSITCRGWSERHKSTSAANRATFWWACPSRPRNLTGRHKSTSAANLLEPWSSPSEQTEKHKSSTPLLCWFSLGHMRTMGGVAARRKSPSAANLLQPYRPKEALTVKRKTSMPLICRGFFGQRQTPRALTGRHKSTSVANLLGPWCSQVGSTERHKPSMPPIRWSPPGLLISLRSATVKRKSVKAADPLQSRWSPAPLTVRQKSPRAAKLSVGAGALCFYFFGYGASDVRSCTGCQSHCAWSGWPSEKRCPIVLPRFMPADEGVSSTSSLKHSTRSSFKRANSHFYPSRSVLVAPSTASPHSR